MRWPVVGVAAVIVAGALTAGCAGGDQRAAGTVVAVEGDLTTVTSFDLQTDRGRMRFVPGTGVTTFADAEAGDGTPLVHLRDHLRDGHQVRVTYRVEDGVNVALRVEDG